MNRPPAGYSRAVLVGAGSFGTVHRAWEESAGRWVALKRLARLENARAEAAILAKGLPCLPLLHTVFPSKGAGWISMEFLRGTSLRTLSTLDPSPEELASIGASLCRAVAILHEAGIAHGDLKPENILVDPAGQVRLMDLGLSGGVAGGSTGYAAPEMGTPGVDRRRCDLWSLGQVLHELLAGARATYSDRRSGWVRVGAVAPGWAPVLDALLSENPADRPDSAQFILPSLPQAIWNPGLGDRIGAAADRELASKLSSKAGELVRRSRSREALHLIQEALDLDPDQSEALALLPRLRMDAPRRRWIWILAGALLVLVAGVAIRMRLPDEPDPTLPAGELRDRVLAPATTEPSPPVPLRTGGR